MTKSPREVTMTDIEWIRANIKIPKNTYKEVYEYVEAVDKIRLIDDRGSWDAAVKLVPDAHSVKGAHQLDTFLSRFYGRPSEKDIVKMEAAYAHSMMHLCHSLRPPRFFFEICEHMIKSLRCKRLGKDMVVVVENLNKFYLVRDDEHVGWMDVEQTTMPVTAELNAMLGWKDRVEYDYKGTRVVPY